MIPTLIGSTFLVYFLVFLVQYLKYLGNILRGDFGYDFNGNSVATLIATALPYTLVLALSAFVLKILIGIALGVWTGLRQGKLPDTFNLFFTIFFLAVPGFIIAYFSQFVFGVKLHVLPISGVRTGSPMAFILPASCSHSRTESREPDRHGDLRAAHGNR